MSHKTTVHIADLHFDLRIWGNELKFVKDEIAIFEHRLEELVNKNTNKEMLAELEHFQNQFIRQNEATDEMAKKVRAADAELAKFAQAHTVATEHVRMDDHMGLREDLESYRSRYSSIKADFQRFSAKWM